MQYAAIKQTKQQYNTLIKRYKKYEEFVENPNISMEDKYKWVPEAKLLINQLGGLLVKLKDLEVMYTHEEVLNGFSEEILNDSEAI